MSEVKTTDLGAKEKGDPFHWYLVETECKECGKPMKCITAQMPGAGFMGPIENTCSSCQHPPCPMCGQRTGGFGTIVS